MSEVWGRKGFGAGGGNSTALPRLQLMPLLLTLPANPVPGNRSGISPEQEPYPAGNFDAVTLFWRANESNIWLQQDCASQRGPRFRLAMRCLVGVSQCLVRGTKKQEKGDVAQQRGLGCVPAWGLTPTGLAVSSLPFCAGLGWDGVNFRHSS